MLPLLLLPPPPPSMLVDVRRCCCSVLKREARWNRGEGGASNGPLMVSGFAMVPPSFRSC